MSPYQTIKAYRELLRQSHQMWVVLHEFLPEEGYYTVRYYYEDAAQEGFILVVAAYYSGDSYSQGASYNFEFVLPEALCFVSEDMDVEALRHHIIANYATVLEDVNDYWRDDWEELEDGSLVAERPGLPFRLRGVRSEDTSMLPGTIEKLEPYYG